MASKLSLSVVKEASEVAEFRHSAFGDPIETALKDVTRRMRQGKAFVARRRGKAVAMLYLTVKKPWAIDASYFTPVSTPLYLLGMAVAPPLQRSGIGRLCLREVDKLAASWPAQAIRLDAYDSPTGAGGFYQRCGYREVGQAVYRNTALIYFERLVAGADNV